MATATATHRLAQVQAQIDGVERELERLHRQINSGHNVNGSYADHLECRLVTLEHMRDEIAATADRRNGQARKTFALLSGIGLAVVLAALSLSACGTAPQGAAHGASDPIAPTCVDRPIYWLRADGHMLQGAQEECGMVGAYAPAVACATGDYVRLYYVVPCTAAHTYIGVVDGQDR